MLEEDYFYEMGSQKQSLVDLDVYNLDRSVKHLKQDMQLGNGSLLKNHADTIEFLGKELIKLSEEIKNGY